MTTLIPRSPYTKEELDKLYPKDLQIQLVQILLRHGERTPVSARFQNAGLAPYWPYCSAAKQIKSVILNNKDFKNWDELKYRRRIETFGKGDTPTVAGGPSGEYDCVCTPGELTDTGRETTLALGQRLRHLYVEQLGFMPKLISDSDMIYLRATPIPRALESVQQTFWGLYPPSARTADFPTPTIITRSYQDETLFPNDIHCKRFAQLSKAFAQRSAEKWNDSDDMKYLTDLLSKWMPDGKPVAVDSSPRLSGIMDTVNSTLAHGKETRLPSEFYDKKARDILDKVVSEEWFSGYRESLEFRALGIGALWGDMMSRITGSVERNGHDGIIEIGGEDGALGQGRGGEKDLKLALSGCHDTTLAGVIASIGAFEDEKWPPYTSHVAIELLRKTSRPSPTSTDITPGKPEREQTSSWWSSLFGLGKSTSKPFDTKIGRRPMADLTESQRRSLDGYYVRVRYNDEVMQIPSCREQGNHYEGDTSLCTLEAFKNVVDRFIPQNWKQACNANLDAPPIPEKPEPAGY
ncbi:phosphoglycerate mutase-like protein [Patellaria atrata CBS 101060]|uniref:3-phytase n=1 Tax=Patellaria atrata CBS 101060 TaxID=1346257 RepID=A0A9P4SJ70_9PEZI|nr:phosphoglycerate mutase-like protein [Patellaria atrata CBS 101060]